MGYHRLTLGEHVVRSAARGFGWSAGRDVEHYVRGQFGLVVVCAVVLVFWLLSRRRT